MAHSSPPACREPRTLAPRAELGLIVTEFKEQQPHAHSVPGAGQVRGNARMNNMSRARAAIVSFSPTPRYFGLHQFGVLQLPSAAIYAYTYEPGILLESGSSRAQQTRCARELTPPVPPQLPIALSPPPLSQ